jgi:CRISPR-associated endonuclease/helicase Cas3
MKAENSGQTQYYAHTCEDASGNLMPEDSGTWQPLVTHLQNVAALASQFALAFDASDEAYLAGLLHDLGKYREEFQKYLRALCSSSPETQHAIFGAAATAESLFATRLTIAGHHSGLHDFYRIEELCTQTKLRITETVPILLKHLEAEYGSLPATPTPPSWVSNNTFSAEFYTRLIFSCVVDADRLDTAYWPNHPPAELRLDPETLLQAVQSERSAKAAAFPDSPLLSVRNRIFDSAIKAGERAPGFFSLTVPTGGGKTLAAMAFALAHAKRHGMRRVIVVIPYLSIIEQNAAEYRRILGDHIVLENHSGVSPKPDVLEDEKSRLELVSENWDAPVIVTTSVQFLESLLASSPSRCRKLHRVPRSVVIFDEVQTLPSHLLQPTFSILRELALNYGTSFVFSSATQPAFLKGAAIPDGLSPSELREIAPAPDELFRQLRRVKYQFPALGETLDWPTLAAALAKSSQVLCVVNLTRHAKELWEELGFTLRDRFGNELEDETPIHLSSAMCPEHRLSLIKKIKAALTAGRSCRVISTQLIEAGVDVDFPQVWRALGPLDSIVQVAGRCNREGRLAFGTVHVFQPADHKLPQGVYRSASDQAAISIARMGDEAAERLAISSDVFPTYFQALYQVVNTDYAMVGEDTIQEDRRYLRYREVARKGVVIGDSGTPVIVEGDSHGNIWAGAVIEELRNREVAAGQPRFTCEDMRNLQRFMVNVLRYKFDLLMARGLIRPLLPNLELYVLDVSCYHPNLGLILDNTQPDDFIA